MKNFLLTLLAAGALTASAAVAPPDALYLVGNINEWITPTDGGTQFALLPDDNGGLTYRGTFDFPDNYLEFKVFTNVADWTDPEAYLGCNFSGLYSFKDEPDTFPLGIWPEGFGNNIWVQNWTGGTLEVTVTLQPVDGKFTAGSITLLSHTQPPYPTMPEHIYVIGKFNGYALPDGDNLNGAIPMSIISEPGEVEVFHALADIPDGEAEFVLYYLNPDTHEVQYVNGPENPIELYSEDEGPVYTGFVIQPSNERGTPFVISNFTGGKIDVRYVYLSGRIWFGWLEAPLNDFPNTLNMILDTDEGKILYKPVQFPYLIPEYKGYIKSVIFTSEDSVEPTLDSVWGVAADTPEMISTFEKYVLVKGGEPLRLDGQLCTLFCTIDRYNHILGIERTLYTDYNKLDCIYMVGDVNDWKAPVEANSATLEHHKIPRTGDSLFEADFLSVGRDILTFRFYSELTGWDGGASVGSQWDDFTQTDVYFDADNVYESSLYVGGYGNWLINTDADEFLCHIKVDFKQNKITIKKLTSGISSIDTPEEEAIYYNLQGVRVANPTRGLYIKVTPKASERVYIR